MAGWATMISNHYMLVIAFTCLCIALTTHTLTTLRARTGRVIKDASGKIIGRTPPTAPYSIPIVGHFFALLWDVQGTLRRARNQCGSDAFCIKVLGRSFRVITYKHGINEILKKADGEQASASLETTVLRNVFGLPAADANTYLSLKPQLDATMKAHIDDQTKKQEILQAFAAQVKAHTPDLVTFNPSPVDQEPWERTAQPDLSEDRETVTVDLFALICAFTTHLTIDVLLSPSLLSQEPETAKLLTDFRSSFVPLLTGLPRTFPWLRLPKAHIVRRSLMARTTSFVRAVTLAREDEDPGPEYRDLMDSVDSIKPLLGDRQAVFASPAGQSLSGTAIAADFASLLWTVNAPNALCSWLLVHLASSADGLLEQVRAEIEPYADAKQPEGIFGFSVSPQVNVDIDGLLNKCPLLQSCWLETVRLYGRGTDLVSPSSRLLIPTGNADERVIIEKDERIVVPMWCPNLDDQQWRQASLWRGDRHLGDERDDVVVSLGGMGSDIIAPISRAFCLSFIAAFVLLWDIEPIDENRCLFPPAASFAAAVAMPSSTFRAKLRKRPLQPEKIMRRP